MLDVRNPRTGETDHRIRPVTAAEMREIAAASRAAQPEWQARGFEGRSEALRRFADLLESEGQPVIDALSTDTGRARIARLEVAGAVASLRGWAASAGALMPSETWVQGRSNPQFKHRNDYVAYALVGVISPWNFPVTLSFIDTIPALMAGACVIVKPSEVTPRFADALMPLVERAGFADILTFVQGAGETGAALVDVADCVCFTGSVETGRKVAVQAAGRLIPAMLELGGKDPLIVAPGADLEAAARLALRSSVLATGQACQSIERVYVQADDHDAFLSALKSEAEAVQLNRQDIGRGHLGPFIDARQARVVIGQIEDAVAKGAQVVTGGELEGGSEGSRGHWLRPTVLADVTHDMNVMRDETFGPVIPVMAYRDVDEAVALANDTAFGLSAAVFAADIPAAEAIAERLHAGAISLQDAALTGQYFEAGKQSFGVSGLGPSRMGADGLLRFFRKRAFIANTGAPLTIGDFAEDG